MMEKPRVAVIGAGSWGFNHPSTPFLERIRRGKRNQELSGLDEISCNLAITN